MVGQATAHGLLRNEFKRLANALQLAAYENNVKRAIFLFKFRPENGGADGIAARIFTYKDYGTPTQTQTYTRVVNQAKRSLEANHTSLFRRSFTPAERDEHLQAGMAYEYVVRANLSHVEVS